MTGAETQVQAKRKTKVGRVVSDKMDKTIVVSVERLARHRLYKRVIRLTTKFKAHDEADLGLPLALHWCVRSCHRVISLRPSCRACAHAGRSGSARSFAA